MTFKVDMAKAYDKLEWRFLLKAMEKFGFPPQVIDLVYRNICNIWYNFRINGEAYELGEATTGLPSLLGQEINTQKSAFYVGCKATHRVPSIN